MKILHIINDSNIGGAGKLLYNISRCIDRKKFEFVFIFIRNSKLIDLFKPIGFKIYSIDTVADKSFDIKSLLLIKKIIKKETPNVVHTHSSLSGKIALKLLNRADIKSVYTKHCVFGTPLIMKYSLAKKIYGYLDDKLSDIVIAVAESAKDELISFGVNPSKIKVIINGSHPLNTISQHSKDNLKKKLKIKPDEFVVGISARLEPYKGHKTFLEAAKLSLNNKDRIKFIIMGDGSYRQELEKYAQKLGVSSNIIFLGFINNVTAYMNIFDVNVNCSTGTETSSLAISEGLSIGKPAIVSNYGGNPNMVINGITGYVIAQNDPEALYKAILKTKSNVYSYKKMCKHAQNDYNKRFSDKKMTVQYEKIYKELICNSIDLD